MAHAPFLFQDFISDMVLHSDGKTLLATGGDGHLSVWNRKSGASEYGSQGQIFARQRIWHI